MHKDVDILHRFRERDAFVGYQKDVAAAVVFQASSQLRKTCDWRRELVERKTCDQQREPVERKTCDQRREPVELSACRRHLWEAAWEEGLLGSGPLVELARQKEGSDPWKEAVGPNV